MPQTGPKTSEGRDKSSQNAIKHGLTSSRMYVFDNESPEKWAAFLQVWTARLQPADDAEMCVVLDIAHAQWKLRRARTYETGLMNFEMEEQAEKLAAIYEEEVDEGIRQASAFKGLADNSRSLDLLHRYETRARRAFERGLAALEKLRAMAPAVSPAVEAEVAEADPPSSGPAEPVTTESRHEPPAPCENENLQNEIPAVPRSAAELPVPPDSASLQNEITPGYAGRPGLEAGPGEKAA